MFLVLPVFGPAQRCRDDRNLQRGGNGGIAWWAHIAGFSVGLILTPVLRQRSRRQFRHLDAMDRWHERR
ncbi:MAG: rhomboid family intramembrane serine protease [Anaerolineales bacterium]|nr:MAG: rhomboid family intramembrane serine protease [Anaerolineales bacterium]